MDMAQWGKRWCRRTQEPRVSTPAHQSLDGVRAVAMCRALAALPLRPPRASVSHCYRVLPQAVNILFVTNIAMYIYIYTVSYGYVERPQSLNPWIRTVAVLSIILDQNF